jgi:glycosyltransferase involved in cell wall biosynthesis
VKQQVLIVTNLLTHYRKPLYELLADRLPARFVFYSDGQEWYWRAGSLTATSLPSRALKGHWIGSTRVTPGLIPEVWRNDHDVVIKDINGRFALPVTYALCRVRRQRFVLWTGLWRHPEGRFHSLTRPFVTGLYRRADAILTYGRHVQAYVVQQGADPARVVVAPQSVDLDVFRPLPAVARPSRPLILFVGRLERWKGPDVLIEALGLLKSSGVPFVAELIGSGSLRDELARRLAELALADDVALVDALPNNQLPERYNRATITVVPSVWTPEFSEPWSLAVNEAMACNSLVVATTSVGAVADGLVTNGVTGVVVDENDPEALAAGLAEALADPARITQMTRAAAPAITRYSYADAAKAFEQAVSIARSTRRGRHVRGALRRIVGSRTPGERA